ncbi:Oxidoreductase, FAD-binding protein [Pseudomonas amygdali pv. lachrymans]|nr:Oxidoreductase, FAD-binding protein [Pseudomonas amygdali pv. lachrymans]
MCGSEGSLGFIVEARLNVLPIPKHSILVNVRYTGFMDALRDAKALMAHKPLSIETVDSKVLMLAMQDIVWHGVAEYFPQDPATPTLGINLIEFSGDELDEVEQRVHAFVAHLQKDTSVVRLGHTLATGSAAVNRVYAMRKRSVGLLGNVKGEALKTRLCHRKTLPITFRSFVRCWTATACNTACLAMLMQACCTYDRFWT